MIYILSFICGTLICFGFGARKGMGVIGSIHLVIFLLIYFHVIRV